MAARSPTLTSPHRAAWEELERGARDAEDAVGLTARSIAIGEVRFELRFAGPALLDALFPALAHLERKLDGPRTISVTLWDSASTGIRPPVSRFRPGDHVSRSGELSPGVDRSIHILTLRGFPVVMAWDSERAAAIVWAADAAELPPFERANPLRTLLQWVLEPHGFYFVHGACVAGETGVLIGGVGGAGKSTTAVACARLGLAYVADDYVALAGTSHPAAWSLYSTAKLDDQSVEMVGGLDRVPRGRRGDDPPKQILMMAQAPHVRVRSEAALSAIVLPRRDVIPGLRPTGAASALRTLAASSVLQMPRDGHAAMRYLAELVRAIPVYELGLDGDPLQAAGAIASLCGPGADG